MNLMTLVSAVAEATGLAPKQVRSVLDSAFQTMSGSLLHGETVRTPVGTFSVKARAAKKGWNIHTGSPVKIPATKVVKFKPAAALKDAVGRGRKTLAKKTPTAATKTVTGKKAVSTKKAAPSKAASKKAAAATSTPRNTAARKTRTATAKAAPAKRPASRKRAS